MDVVKEDLKSVCVREEFVMQTVSRGGVDSKFEGIFFCFPPHPLPSPFQVSTC